MIRRLYGIFAGVSLLLCLGTLSLWIGTNGKSRPHVLIGDLSGWSAQVVAVRSEGGFLTLYWTTQRPMHWPPPSDRDVSPSQIVGYIVQGWELSHDNGWPSQLGFAWIQFSPQELRQNLPMLSRLIMAGCPHWFIVLLTAIPPGFWLYRRRKQRSTAPGICRQCAYDLTGNASGVCPECGTLVASPAEFSQ